MIASADEVETVKAMCGDTVELLLMDHDDCWSRDNGPTFVVAEKRDKDREKGKDGDGNKDENEDGSGDLVGIDWDFNAWGGKYPNFVKDNQVPAKLCAAWGIPCVKPHIILEGGSIHTNGNGTLVTTAECLLNKNRNPNLTQAEIEATLKHHLGVTRVIWLPYGLYGDETDGHVDNVCSFIGADTAVVPWTDDAADPNYARLCANRAELERSGISVECLPHPPVVIHNGLPLTLSYVNFLFVNGGIVMPVFGGVCEKTDAAAVARMKALFPQREVVAVPSMAIVQGGGNIHCITQQVPRVGESGGRKGKGKGKEKEKEETGGK